ncbi:MAG TPA: FecR family protein [Verrucomicrobiae bacterium]|nr:FecR family protein [Verrucomicrobiae bacterium]
MAHSFWSRISLVLLSIAGCGLLVLPAFADSQARIVRLSDVQGSVQIDKNSGLGFESAFINLPITQGTQLRTRDNGRAEIEFEDGSTMRLAPNSTVQFSTLGSSDSGKHLSVINLVDGMAYVNWIGKSGDEIDLNFAHEKVALDRETHLRVDTSEEVANLAVFRGAVEVTSPSGDLSVGKNKTATFRADDDKYEIANHVVEAPLDSWDKEAIAYHDQYAKNNSSPYGYGSSDLGYYGSYTSIPGYGMMWQPYFTGIGWDPFMDGAWAWYPGFGYMFVSAYPWGWMPYLYGNWMFVPGFGWMWQPGGWNTWNSVPRYSGGPALHVHPLVAPTGTVRTMVVGKGGPLTSTAVSSRFVLNSGTAGLGVPRGSINNLRHLNTEVAKRGFAEVRPAPQFSTTSARSPAFRSGFGGAPRSGGIGGSAPIGHSSGSVGHTGGGGVHH